MVFERLQRVDRELYNRNVSLRIKVPQHTPGAMIEAPLVTVQPYPVRLGYFHNPLGQLRQTRRRVIESKQLRGKAIEIVYSSWLRHGSYGGSTKEPVCRNYQQRLRSRQFPAHLPPGLGKAIYRSEEHTSELQSRENLVCRLLLGKKTEAADPRLYPLYDHLVQ